MLYAYKVNNDTITTGCLQKVDGGYRSFRRHPVYFSRVPCLWMIPCLCFILPMPPVIFPNKTFSIVCTL